MSTINKANYICYYNDMVLLSKPQQVESMCAEITFYNKGVSTMVVNEIPFPPGTGIAFDGKDGQLDTTKYNLRFIGSGQNGAFVIRKCYSE